MSPPTETTASIDDLPPEMICELFKYLPLKDLLACSIVNRRWHSIYAGFKLHRLFVIQPHADDRHLHWSWFDSDQTTRKEDWCFLAMFLHLAEKPLLSNLKHLALDGFKFEFDPNKLNRFRQLVHLEIHIILDTKLNLNLPKLKVLALPFIDDGALSIDCPELRTLLCFVDRNEDTTLFDLKHPETIRKLETGLVGRSLVLFNNVECLVTGKFEAISKSTLLSLPKLRELRFETNIRALLKGVFRGDVGSVDRMKRKVSEFVNEAKKLKGSDFRFTFCGLQLANVNMDQIDFCVQLDEAGYEEVYNEYIYMKNYHLIEPGALLFLQRVDYTSLLSHVTGEFPRCFSQKFTGIRTVRAKSEVQDAGQFLWFLKSLRLLEVLHLEKTGLRQEFYDQLPASACSLIELTLRRGHCEDGLQLNFDFIGEFSYLLELNIFPGFSLRSATSLIRWFDKLDWISFGICFNTESRGFVKGISKWIVFGSDRHSPYLFDTENRDEIVNFIEGLEENQAERGPASD